VNLSEINDFYLLINAVVAGAQSNVIDAGDSLNVINMRCVLRVCEWSAAGYPVAGLPFVVKFIRGHCWRSGAPLLLCSPS